MHEKILQSAGNTPQSSYVPYGCSKLEEQGSRMSSSIQTNMSEGENQHAPAISATPILPGTGSITHNVTRMLKESAQTLRTQLPITSPRAARYSPYSTAHFMSYIHNTLHTQSLTDDTDVSQEDSTSDISNGDMSISTEGFVSPNSSSAATPPPQYGHSSTNGNSVHFSPLDDSSCSTNSSPSGVSAPSKVASSYSSSVPNTDRVNSVEDSDKQPKKNVRTNYTNEQVQALLKIFHETPYPDYEMMENIGKDLGISEKQIKILQLAGNTPQSSYVPYGSSKLEEQGSRMSSSIQTNMSEGENQHAPAISAVPILPGTGSITHNITRMLKESVETLRTQLPSTSPRAARYSPYSTAHFMSYSHNTVNTLHKHSLTDDADVSQEDSTSDISNGDMSISTEGFVSPNSSSAATPPPQYGHSSTNGNSVHFSPLDDSSCSTNSSPSGVSAPSKVASSYSSSVPNTDRVNSVEDSDKQPKKNVRTNYTNEQVQALLKIFHETPYPDYEMMENIGKDLGISDKQIKVWFQNKRARWRRRNDAKNNNQQPFLPVSPMLSPVAPYGYMPTGHIMTSSPLQNFPGYFNYPWMQGYLSQNNNQLLPGQMLSNQIPPIYQTTNQSTASQKNAPLTNYSAQLSPTMSSDEFGKTLPQQTMSNQNRHSFQYSGYMYPSTYTPVS